MRAGPACSYTGRGTGADIGPLPHRGGKAPVLIKRAAAGRGGFLIASDRFQAMTGLIGKTAGHMFLPGTDARNTAEKEVYMVNRIYSFMTRHNMTAPGSRVLAAVSGGADSMCLLEVLSTLRPRAGFELRVLHVHHGLRESAEGDLDHVSKYCVAAGIPFQAVRVDAGGHAAECGMSVEEAARTLRYEALERSAREWDEEQSAGAGSVSPCRVAVAHHIEDQAETVVFNLLRGSRLTGLRGMQPVNGRIIRPMLEVSRTEIEGFLMQRGISWREDETNEDMRYTRNLIRKEVMPLLLKINAGAREHIARAAEEAAETEEFLKFETDRALRACYVNSQVSIPALMLEPALLRRRAIYAVIADAAGGKKDLQDAHVQAVLRLMQKKGNGDLDLVGGVHVRKSYDLLYFFGSDKRGASQESREERDEERGAVAQAAAEASVPAAATDSGPLRWPTDPGEFTFRVFAFEADMDAVPRNLYTKWLDYDKIGTFPEFRNRREGDRITLDESGRSKTIARYMIDAKIPKELRGKIVMPVAGSEILWIPNGRISAAYKVSSRTRTILEIRWDPDADKEPRTEH